MAADQRDMLIHPLVVRITHWVNVVALTIMIASGLRIFNAYPAFARRGESPQVTFNLAH